MGLKQGVLKDMLLFIAVFLVVFYVAFMMTNPFESVSLPDVDMNGGYNNSQASMLMRYLAYSNAEESAWTQYRLSGPWRVVDGWDQDYNHMLSVYNYLTTEWANARQVLIDNYDKYKDLFDKWDGSPYKNPDSWAEPFNLSPTAALAFIAQAIPESTSQPGQIEYQSDGRNRPDMTASLSEWTTYYNSFPEDYPNFSTSTTYGLKSRQSNTYAFGMFQMDGSRRYQQIEFALAMGMDPRDLDAQLLYFALECYAWHNANLYTNGWAKLKEDTSTTFEEAAFKDLTFAVQKNIIVPGNSNNRCAPLWDSWDIVKSSGATQNEKPSNPEISKYSSLKDWVEAYVKGDYVP